MATSYDVAVIGLGGMGSAAAYHLAARGSKVLGLEKFGPVHNRGSSHGGSRIIRQSYFEDPAYVPLLLRAYELWEALQRDSGRGLINLTGGLMIGRADSLTVAGSLKSALEWDLPHEILDASQIRRRLPTMVPDDDVIALCEAKAGYVKPEDTVAAHIALAQRCGAELHFEEPVLRWQVDEREVRITTGHGVYTAGRLVIAPGAWAPQLLPDLGVPLTVERQVQYWFDPVGGIEPFLPDRHPIFIWEGDAGRQFYGFPAHNGADGGVKVAFFRGGAECTPDTIDRTVGAHEVEAMATFVRPRMPSLPGRFLRAATCMYTNTPDKHFVITVHPAHERVTVAYGFSGHGFKFVPVVGEVLADLALSGRTDHPIDLFNPFKVRR